MLSRSHSRAGDVPGGLQPPGRIGAAFSPVAALGLGLLLAAAVLAPGRTPLAQQSMDDLHSRIGRQDAVQGGRHRQPTQAEIEERLRHLRMRSEERARDAARPPGAPTAGDATSAGPGGTATPPGGEGRR